MDDAPAPVERDAARTGFQVGDRVRFEGEVRRIGEENALIRFWSGSMFQLVWVKLKHLLRIAPDSSR